MTDEECQEHMAELLDHIMKKCLWQFHSRAWDRERQNENILDMTTKLLCNQEVDLSTPEQRCYYADADELARAYHNEFSWIADLGNEEIQQVMKALHEELDRQTITESLNAELTETLY
ncbi:Fe-only nitrogenase subunit delta [Propionibacterium sp.]|uniref:Fe-only nitrogenase subunit delta n=1 Tax=Propionibacterium sp. TaxID=1977903 RepID=UPI0039EC626B